jgi:hypothetical protein
MPFDRPDILQQAGFETEDIITLSTISPSRVRLGETSSASFTPEPGLFRYRVQWDELIPAGAQPAVNLTLRHNVGAGETYAARVQNNNDTTTAVTVGPKTQSGSSSSGWVDYSPATTASPIQLTFEHKTDPGDNTSSAEDPYFRVGARL